MNPIMYNYNAPIKNAFKPCLDSDVQHVSHSTIARELGYSRPGGVSSTWAKRDSTRPSQKIPLQYGIEGTVPQIRLIANYSMLSKPFACPLLKAAVISLLMQGYGEKVPGLSFIAAGVV